MPLIYSEEDQKALSDMFFLATAFTDQEIHQMFLKFYKEIDQDQNMTMDIEEVRSLFERYGQRGNLKDRLKKLIQIIGVDPDGGIISLLKEG